ncbi:hypothetical protein D3C72_651360 [compost metagenome]
MQDRHFALFFHHHQAKRRDDVKRGDGNDQAQQQPHHVLFHTHGLEQLAFAITPVRPFGAFRQFLLAQGIHFQRFIEPQTPAADVAQRIAHQARSVLNIDQHLIAVDFAIGGERTDNVEQTLARQAAHRRELTGRGHHHAQLIATVDAQLAGKLFAENHVVFAGFKIGLFDVGQIGCERVFLRRIDTQHHAHRHAARALQHHVTGGQRRNAAHSL